jgi:hypothetical protein
MILNNYPITLRAERPESPPFGRTRPVASIRDTVPGTHASQSALKQLKTRLRCR